MEDFYRGVEDKTMAPAARGSGKKDAVNDAAGAGLIWQNKANGIVAAISITSAECRRCAR
jgi:hypothetical protein